MKIAQIKKDLLNWRKLSPGKILKYLSIVVGSIIFIFTLIFILFPDPFINGFLKDRINKTLTENYPAYSIKLGDLHYSIWKNRLGCDSILLKSNDSSFNCNTDYLSVSGISWIKILLQNDFSSDVYSGIVIDAQNVVLTFRKSRDEISLGMMHISIPDSEITIDSVKYYSLMNDERFFAKSQFRQTRYRSDIPKIKISGVDFLAALKENIYSAGIITINDMFVDIFVNMDKPYENNSLKPLMPNEFLKSVKETFQIDSLKIINGRLKYCERYAVGAKPGTIFFDKVKVFMSGISNSGHNTTIVRGEGVFMNSAKMKLLMTIPLTSKDFSLKYSGSLSTLDATRLNEFIEAGEHQRIKSGIVHSAAFNVDVVSGNASGNLRAEYQDLSVSLLNKKTGSEKGIFDWLSSLYGKTFIIRETNLPNQGFMRIGKVNYKRNQDDYFVQFLWFALRGAIGDVVGF